MNTSVPVCQVKVLTGSSNLPGGTSYTGTDTPPRLLGKAFALTFVTDGSQALQGFQAHWSREYTVPLPLPLPPYWTGLDWTGLDWTGLDLTPLDST